MSDNVFSNPQAYTSPLTTGNDIPVESISLPSKGLVYESNHPLYNEDHVEIRCMTAREEDILTSPALLKNGTVFEKLTEACLLNKTIDPSSLLIGDRNAILVGIRVSGYGPKFSANITCQHCKHEYDADFSLGSLSVKPLGATPLKPNSNMFGFTLPISGAAVVFKLLTGKDSDEISKIAESKKKLGQQVESSVTMRLIKQILSVNGNEDPAHVAKFVNTMRAGDSRALRTYINSIAPDVDTTQKTKCVSCSEESEVMVPFDLSFFWPDF